MSANLWEQVHMCFDTDDGSLPAVVIDNLPPVGVASVYLMLRQRSRMATAFPQFHSYPDDAALPVDSVPNAAALVPTGQAAPFHHCIAGVVAGGVELPVLRVYVWPDAVELDYRMGPEWGPTQVAGFFDLLRDCCVLAPGAVVVSAVSEGPPYSARFSLAWAWYRDRHRGGDLA